MEDPIPGPKTDFILRFSTLKNLTVFSPDLNFFYLFILYLKPKKKSHFLIKMVPRLKLSQGLTRRTISFPMEMNCALLIALSKRANTTHRN